jgi:hypothetical protein
VPWFKEHAHRRQVGEWRSADQQWQAEHHQIESLLTLAQTFTGATAAEEPGITLALHRGEHVFYVGQGAALIESRRLPSQWQGGYSGF